MYKSASIHWCCMVSIKIELEWTDVKPSFPPGGKFAEFATQFEFLFRGDCCNCCSDLYITTISLLTLQLQNRWTDPGNLLLAHRYMNVWIGTHSFIFRTICLNGRYSVVAVYFIIILFSKQLSSCVCKTQAIHFGHLWSWFNLFNNNTNFRITIIIFSFIMEKYRRSESRTNAAQKDEYIFGLVNRKYICQIMNMTVAYCSASFLFCGSNTAFLHHLPHVRNVHCAMQPPPPPNVHCAVSPLQCCVL
jgi:hypothetical protein